MCLQFFAKYLLFSVNLVIMLAGAALIAIGVIVLVDVQAILDLLPVDVSAVPIYVIVIGCIIVVITFPGCYGAITETRCWLITYAVFMLILTAASSYLAYLIFDNLSVLPEKVIEWVTQAFENSVMSGAFTVFETTFQCCGSTGADSYTALGLPIPPTCCPQPENNVCPADFSYSGCAARFGNYLDSYGEAVGIGIIVIIVVEVIAILAAFYMNHKITKKMQRRSIY